MSRFRLRRIGVASNEAVARPSLSDCIEQVLAQVEPLGGDVLDALKAFVARPASKSHQQDVDPPIEQAVAQLLGESDAVRATLCAELRRLVYQSGSHDFAQSPMGRVEDIHVFDLGELEAHIEAALARLEVMRAVDDVLPLFDSLVTALLGWSTVQPGLNPLKPEAFVRALNETLDAWVSDEAVRMALLRPAAIALGIGLRQLYREACDWMRSQGVEPVDQAGGKPREGVANNAGLAETEVERTVRAFDKLRRLLSGQSLAALRSAGHRDFTNTMPASFVALQDLKLVEPMMKRLADRPVSTLERPALTMVHDAGAPQPLQSQAQNQQIGRQLGEEVVRMMLDQLVRDERLAVLVRMQLRALEPVLVRLAKSDPRFFIDRDHPARQLLDNTARRSLVFAKDGEEDMQGFVACVAKAVDVLSKGPGDAPSFVEVLAELQEDWDAFAHMRRRQRDDVLNARQHSEQRMLLAQRFSGAMMERFKSSNLPELAASFLRGPWSQVLAETHLRHESTAADPRGFLAVVDDLVWSVRRPLAPADYARLVRLIPRLLARLNEGLMLIHYPHEPVSIFLDRLSALHEKILDEYRRALAAARAAAAARTGPDEPAPVEDSVSSGLGDSGMTPFPDRRARPRPHQPRVPGATSVRDLTAGAWVDLLLGGNWVRAELTWISQNRNLYMFVSGPGLSHGMSRRSIERLEAQGRMRVPFSVRQVDLELEDIGSRPAEAANEPRV